jgi:hypothetical protein
MAALAISAGVSTAAIIIQGVEAVIPGFIALWDAIQSLRAKNPNMTPAQATALMGTITAAIATLGTDELAVLETIPPVPVKGA